MLGSEIRKVRLAKKLTQEAVSLAAEIDRAYLSEIENDRRSPSVEVLVRLCGALGESAGVVLGRTEGLELEPRANDSAKLVYDDDGVLTKIIDSFGRELVAAIGPREQMASRPLLMPKPEKGRQRIRHPKSKSEDS